jgi:hypothetical protein
MCRGNGSPPPHVVELGCGTGLCGLAAASSGCKVTLTDRNVDLAQINMEQVQSSSGRLSTADIAAYDLSWEGAQDSAADNGYNTSLTVSDIIHSRGRVDLVIGAEITCLRKQQPILVNTIVQLVDRSPDALVLLSFDDVPPPNGCNYEAEMLQLMRERGFRHEVVCVADVDWTIRTYNLDSPAGGHTGGSANEFTRKVSTATMRDRTAEFVDVRSPLVAPFFPVGMPRGDKSMSNNCEQQEDPPLPTPPPRSGVSGANAERITRESTTHHITLFYRPSAVGVCSRCHCEYFRNPAFRSTSRCVYHKSYYVCRYHPAEVRCSINGAGDGLGYYGNGQEGYAAKFWDCCGSEDPAAHGCCVGDHTQY